MANRLAAPNQFETLTTALAANLDLNFTQNQSAWNDSSLGFVNGIPTDTGTVNAYSITCPFGSPSSYNPGMTIAFFPANTNTGASTVTVSPLGILSITLPNGGALQGGELQAGQLAVMICSAGTSFVLLPPQLMGASNNGTIPGLYNGVNIIEDFFSLGQWYAINSGANSDVALGVVTVDAINKGAGVVGFNSGTTTSGYAGIVMGTSGFANGQVYPGLGPVEMDFRFYLSQLPTSGQNFDMYMGLVDTLPTPQNFVIIGAIGGTSLTNWVGSCATAGTSSTTSGVALSALVYTKLQIEINSAWSSATFFANGAQIGSAITTNIPSASALVPIVYLHKTAGTTGVVGYVDKMLLKYTYNV